MITAPCHHSVLLLLAFFLHAQEKGRKRRAPACAAHRAAGRPLKRRGGCFSANCPWGGSESSCLPCRARHRQVCPASAWGFTRRRRWTETRGKAPSPPAPDRGSRQGRGASPKVLGGPARKSPFSRPRRRGRRDLFARAWELIRNFKTTSDTFLDSLPDVGIF